MNRKSDIVFAILAITSIQLSYRFQSHQSESNWECYASLESQVASPIYRTGFQNVTAGFDSVFRNGFFVGLWLLISSLGGFFIVRKDVGMTARRAFVISEAVLGLLAIFWLFNATIMRFGH